MTEKRIFLYVQHLLGIGHLRRAALISSALAERNHDVTLVMGGLPVPGLDAGRARLVQLPPLGIGAGGFHDLVDDAGHSVDEAWKAGRRDQLIACLLRQRPDILLTEAFPFGRRPMRFELLPLLETACEMHPRPRIVCSVRDILKADLKPGRAEETLSLLENYYDLVLVHGDPSFARLEETFHGAKNFGDKIRYTGLVADQRSNGRKRGDGVIVSAGGGAVGGRLLATAIAARPLSRCAASPWRLLAGPNLSEAAFTELKYAAGNGVAVERYRDDFRDLLAEAAVSVSQAGYNTIADLLVAGTPPVLVPFDAGGETEQPLRAQKLAETGWAQIVESDALSAETLANAVDRALTVQESRRPLLELDGARQTAELLQELDR